MKGHVKELYKSREKLLVRASNEVVMKLVNSLRDSTRAYILLRPE
jgi:hypothetical protein